MRKKELIKKVERNITLLFYVLENYNKEDLEVNGVRQTLQDIRNEWYSSHYAWQLKEFWGW